MGKISEQILHRRKYTDGKQAHEKMFNIISLSRVQLFVNPLTIQSMEFSRQEYWSG